MKMSLLVLVTSRICVPAIGWYCGEPSICSSSAGPVET